MKVHLQKTRTQNGNTLRYSIPECGKRGSVNSWLHILSIESFKAISKENKKGCCVNCLALLK